METDIDEKEMHIKELTENLERFQYENQEIKAQTSQLIEQVKKDTQDKEFLVDRRMINQFLITYLSKTSDYKTQQDMLTALSKILQFTNAEKQTLGMLDSETDQASKRGFGQSLVSFLMNDDD